MPTYFQGTVEMRSMENRNVYRIEKIRRAKEARRNRDTQRIEESFFQTPTFQALTIGVPFCTFKLLFGVLCMRVGSGAEFGLQVSFGWLVVVWACTDLIMNLGRVAFHLARRASPIEYCTVAQAGRILRRPRLFLAVDTFISFSIICFVLWSGWIGFLSRTEFYFWYAATTLNLISIAVVNVWLEFRRGSQGARGHR